MHIIPKMIHRVDSFVFGEDMRQVVVVDGPPPPGKSYLTFARVDDEPSLDHYRIFLEGLDEYCAEGLARSRHIIMHPSDQSYGILWSVPYTMTELYLGMAVHEVRHRFQIHCRAPLVTAQDLRKIPRFQDWARINSDKEPIEFDALFFEAYAAYELRCKRFNTDVAVRDIIRMNAEELFKREMLL